MRLNTTDIEAWLRCEDEQKLEDLSTEANRVRQEAVGEEVHLRGLLEIGSYCRRRCLYCGLRSDNRKASRFRLSEVEILACARQAQSLGYGTLVMQSGEDPGFSREWVANVIRTVKDETGLAVTLSLGERTPEDLLAWRRAGADRYLLRFETADAELYANLHPGAPSSRERIERLHLLRDLGYEVGSGVMIGIPGQTWSSLAEDLALFAELDLDMIGVGPWIAHPETPLGKAQWPDNPEQVPNTEAMTYKVLALARLLCPLSNIPATTALATLNPTNGRERALQGGANVIMPNITPEEGRKAYEIYPGKACISETATQCAACLQKRLLLIGRRPGRGEGASLRYQAAARQASRQ